MSKAIQAFDLDLKRRLLSISEADLAARCPKVPAKARTHAAIEAWTFTRPYALGMLAAFEPREAAVLADAWLRIPEALTGDVEMIELRNAASLVLKDGLRHLPIDDLVAVFVEGRIYFTTGFPADDSTHAFLRAHPELGNPAGAFATLQKLIAAIGWDLDSHAKLSPGSLATLLITWLARDGYPPGAKWMVEAWKQHRAKKWIVDRLLGEAICATGNEEAITIIADTLDQKDESWAAVLAVFSLDRAGSDRSGTAFDRLSPRLGVEITNLGDMQKPKRVLEVIAQDGPSAGGLVGYRSKSPQRFMDAEPRWAPLLFSMKSNKYLKDDVKAALASVAPEVLAALKSPAKPGAKVKAKPKAELTRLGDAPFATFAQQGPSVWLGGGRVVVATTATTLSIHEIAEGLPVVGTFVLPEGVAMMSEAPSAYESGWDRVGVHAIAVHPNGSRLALGARTKQGASRVLLLDEKGAVVVDHASEEDDTVIALHWGPKGATLWVLVESAGDYVVLALDGKKLTARGRCSVGGNFPDPVHVTAHPHPVDDVGLFEFACGQDGMWLKCVELGPKLKVRKQKLSSKHDGGPIFGFSADGRMAATSLGQKLLLRSWPEMAPAKGKVLGGSAWEGAVLGETVAVAVATVTAQVDELQLYRMDGGDRVGETSWRASDAVIGATAGAIITIDREAGRFAAFRPVQANAKLTAKRPRAK